MDSSGLTDKPSGLVVITPLEICHAIFLKAAADLSKPGTTAACKAAWKEALMLGIITINLKVFESTVSFPSLLLFTFQTSL